MEKLQNFIQFISQDLMTNPLLQRGAIALGLLSLLFSVLSVYVILRRLAYIGQGISYSAYGGLALGLWLFPALSTPDWRVYAVTAGYCLIVAGLICLCSRRGLIAEDGAIGIFMSTGIAGGLFFFSLQGQHPVAFHNYLFGDVLATGSADLIVLGSITGLVLLALLVFSRWIQLTSFDPVYARAIGIPIHAVQGLILCLLALAVITSIKIAGVFFISALLVFPGAIARLFTLRWTTMLACSLWVGGLTTAAGFLLAMRWETIPPSAIIIALQFGVFLLAWVVSVWRQPA